MKIIIICGIIFLVVVGLIYLYLQLRNVEITEITSLYELDQELRRLGIDTSENKKEI
jgi:hypothetical protein